MRYPTDPRELDWGSMSKDEFKRAEMHYELRDEEESRSETYTLVIDGREWNKTFYKYDTASKAGRTIAARGKDVKIRTYY